MWTKNLVWALFKVCAVCSLSAACLKGYILCISAFSNLQVLWQVKSDEGILSLSNLVTDHLRKS